MSHTDLPITPYGQREKVKDHHVCPSRENVMTPKNLRTGSDKDLQVTASGYFLQCLICIMPGGRFCFASFYCLVVSIKTF